MNKGKIYCIGVGPGDPELITLKAARIIAEADIIAYPYSDDKSELCAALEIAKKACAEVAGKEKLALHIPMAHDPVARLENYRKAAAEIDKCLAAGKTVAYLTLGDPAVYCTYAEIGAALAESGYETEYVPGVPSFCAVAARLGIPLATGSETLAIIPAVYGKPAWTGADNAIYMKAASKMPELKAILAESGAEVHAVSNCGMPGEAVYDDVVAIPDDAGYFTVVVAKKKGENDADK